MIPINLVKTITEVVKETVKGYKLKAEGQDDKYVSTRSAYLMKHWS